MSSLLCVARRCLMLIALTGAGAAAAAPKTADPLAQYIKASSWIASKDGPIFVEFLNDGTEAALRGRLPNESKPVVLLLDSPSDAVVLLSDKRMAFLWQPLKDWAGPGLTLARDRMLAKFRDAASQRNAVLAAKSTSESAVREPVRAVLQLASYLDGIGRGVEAEALLRQQQESMPFKARQSWRGIEWMSVGLGIAHAQKAQGNYEGAIEQYQLLENRMADGPFAINGTINRAETLASLGRYGEALTTIDAAWAQYAATRQGDKIPGSERQFAWIRACALSGLGRKAEAKALLGTLVEDRRLEDEQFVLEPDDSLRFRAALCMKDFPAMKAMLLRDIKQAPAGANALVWLQPGYVPWGPAKAMVEQARADPELRAAAAERMQVLSDELTPALNGWRAQAAAGVSGER